MTEAAGHLSESRQRRFRPYSAYKDSGIEWLGEIPAHWQVQRLKYVATLNDEALPEATDPEFEMTYVDIASVDAVAGITSTEIVMFDKAPSRARRIVRHGDVIISTVRTYLRAITAIQRSEPNLIVSTGFAVIRSRQLESSFASYALRAPHFVERVVANSVGVSYPAINANSLACFELAYPNADEQRAIAAFLDRETAKIDALVAKKERLRELLQEKRTALIARAVTRGLDPNVPMKDSGVEWLRQLPSHWTRLPLKRWVVTKITDGPHETPKFLDEGVQFVSADAVYDGRIDFDRRRGFISEQLHKDYSRKCRPVRDDILVCKSGATTGKLAMVEVDFEFSIWSPLALVRADVLRIRPRFLALALESGYVQEQIRRTWSAGTQPNISMADLGQLFIAAPSIGEQDQILAWLNQKTGAFDEISTQIRTAIDHLQEYRTALISAAVTGKIDVRKEAA